MAASRPKKRRTSSAISAKQSASLSQPKLPWWQLHPTAAFLITSALWVALLYGRTLAEPFVYDDVLTIQHNPHLSSWPDVLRYFKSPVELNNEFRGLGGFIYRPLTWLGFIVTRRLSGLDPTGFHLVNLVFHWANGFIAFLLLRHFRVPWLLAGAACFVWLGLPINSEAVAWVSGRHACQATFFILSSLLAGVAYLNTHKAWQLLAYSSAFFAALLSIEWAFIALLLTVLLMYVHFNFEQANASEKTQEWAHCISLGVAGAAVLCVELALRHWVGADLPIGSLKILPVGLSFFTYLSWMLLPIHMSVERSTDTPGNDLTVWSIAALVATITFLILLWTILRKKFPGFTAGLAWMSICLLPFCGIVFIYQGMAERYTYLASAGLAFSVVALSQELSGSARRLTTSFLVLWVLWGAWRLNARVSDWEDETALFKSSLAVNPKSQVLLYNLGVKSAESDDIDAAITYYQRALDVNPNYLNVLTNLGNLLRNEGNYSAALDLEKRAIAIHPKLADLWVNLGDTYLKQSRTEDAIQSYRRALALDDRHLEATIDLGAALQNQGDLSAAQAQYEKAITIDPRQGAAYCNLGALSLKTGNVEGAIRRFQEAVDHDPSYSQAYFDLGLVYESRGQNGLAISMFEKVLQLKPDDVNTALHLERLQKSH